MDQILLAAATALVTAMATDGWQEARAGAVALWRRVHPDRVPAIESELEEVRAELLGARQSGDAAVETELIADWQRKLRRLTATHPDLLAELEQLTLGPWSAPLSASGQARVRSVHQVAVATGKGTVYQAGRDQHITRP